MNDGIKRVRSVDFNVVLNDGCEAVIHYSVVGSATIAQETNALGVYPSVEASFSTDRTEMSILETDTRVNTTFHFDDVNVVKLENECLNDAEPLTPMQNEPKGFNLEEISWC